MTASHRSVVMLVLAMRGARSSRWPCRWRGGRRTRRPSSDQKNYDELYARYLASARPLPAPPGLWMADLTSDPNARRVNDLVTIRVVESLSATGSADSTVNKKASSADVKFRCPSLVDRRLGQHPARRRPRPSSTDPAARRGRRSSPRR